MIRPESNQENNDNAANIAAEQVPQNESFNFDEWIKETPKTKYLKLGNGEAKVIRFKSGRPDEEGWTDYKGKLDHKVPQVKYLVTTPEAPNEQVQFSVTSKRLAADIKAYFDKGFAELEITKLNTTPVSYRVVPVIAREKQKQMTVPGRTA